MAKLGSGAEQGLDGEERLHDARFHVEGAGTIGFAGGYAKGHFRESAGCVDGVVVAEHEKLASRAGFVWPGDAQMIAAMPLRDALDPQAALAPLGGEQCATAVGGKFFEAGGFREDPAAQRREH